MNMRKWVELPSAWIEEGGLSRFKWRAETGASETAALMVLMAIAHRADLTDGLARTTYDELTTATGISRTKVSDGLDVLEARKLVVREADGRSTYQLTNYGEGHVWAALPAKPLYDRSGEMPMFDDFYLRKAAELDALKIYLTLAARRDTSQNVTRITYDQIASYAGIHLRKIKKALGVLNINGLVTVESYERMDGLPGASHGYRLAHLFPRLHAGTTGRATRGQGDDSRNYE